MGFETYIVVIGQKDGRRHAERFPLNVPLAVARGHFENASDLQLRWLANDIRVEQERRNGGSSLLDSWNPDDSQVRNA